MRQSPRITDLSVPSWLLEPCGAPDSSSLSANHLGSPLAGGPTGWLDDSSIRRLAALIIRLQESWRPLRFVGRQRTGEPVTLLVQRLHRPARVFISALLHPEGDPCSACRDYPRVSAALHSSLDAPIEVAEALVAALEDTSPDNPPARVLLETGATSESENLSHFGAVLPIIGSGERLMGYAEISGPLPGAARLECCALLCRLAATRLAQLTPSGLPLLLSRGTLHGLANQGSALSALTDTLETALDRGRDPSAHLRHLRDTVSRMTSLLSDLRRLTLHLDQPILTSHSVEEVLCSSAAMCESACPGSCSSSCIEGLENTLGELLFPADIAVKIISTLLRTTRTPSHPCASQLKVERSSPFAVTFRLKGAGQIPQDTYRWVRSQADLHSFTFEINSNGGGDVCTLRFPALPVL